MKNTKWLAVLTAALQMFAQLGLPTELAAAIVALVVALVEAEM